MSVRHQVAFTDSAWSTIMAPGHVEEAQLGHTYVSNVARAGPEDVGDGIIALFEGRELTQVQKIAFVCARWLAQEDGRGCAG